MSMHNLFFERRYFVGWKHSKIEKILDRGEALFRDHRYILR